MGERYLIWIDVENVTKEVFIPVLKILKTSFWEEEVDEILCMAENNESEYFENENGTYDFFLSEEGDLKEEEVKSGFDFVKSIYEKLRSICPEISASFGVTCLEEKVYWFEPPKKKIRFQISLQRKRRFLDVCPHLLDDVQALHKRLGKKEYTDLNFIFEQLNFVKKSEWGGDELRFFKKIFCEVDKG